MSELTAIEKKTIEIRGFLASDDVITKIGDEYIKMILKLHPDVKPSAIIEHLNLVQMSGANPYKKQVYFTSYKSKRLGYSVGTTVFSYRFFEDRANQTKEFEGCTCEVSVDDYFDPIKGEMVKTLKAVALAKRTGRADVTFTAWYPEFVQYLFGDVTSIWKSKPHVMLRKCAIAGALRSQFPETLGTFVIEEEYGDLEIEKAETIQQVESDIETTSVQIEKDKENRQSIMDATRKEPVIEEIKKLSSEITSHMNKEDKVEWMNKTLLIDRFERLKGNNLDYLKALVEKLKGIKSTAQVVK